MTRLAIVADEHDAALAAVHGELPWGESAVFAPGRDERVRAFAPDVVVGLAEAGPPAESGAPTIRLPAGSGRAEGARTIAQAGEGLWRRAPWPANDGLWSMPPPGGGLLLVGPATERRAVVAGKLRDRGLTPFEADRLRRDDLERSGVVILLGSGPEPRLTEEREPLPALAMAVLAAGRVLVVERSEPEFGLIDGITHFAFDADDEAAEIADAAATFPEAFESVRAMGRLAAAPHRASVAYGRLVADALRETGG